MTRAIISFSVKNKFIVVLFVLSIMGWGLYSLYKIPVGAVPDITNNQVQILTTTRQLATEEVEKFITAPVELAISNLQGVQEIRSVSKFGLSVVTVVFDEKMGTYLPRQLIEEKLKSIRESILTEFGTPEMGPISTGLGEIYQYVLDVEPTYKNKYSVADLRTIQDWIVKRQLSGIPGVVEINTWGGYLKEYEVAIDPAKISQYKISLSELFEALQANNTVSGGGYIEKSNSTHFIRSDGLMTSLDDIKSTVIKRIEGVPILVKDVAEVRYGHALRFGAITGNGEGEKVMGQIMMLKNGNSSQVISQIKQRVQEIQKSLPEGVYINPFLERSELIEKTTDTVKENLLLGALIVIFVLVLLLGHPASAFIVASVIPIALLFGISLMNLFGLSANLMSLGAIDFGIIIDGAVIIVEFILFRFSSKIIAESEGKEWPQKEKDQLAIESASLVMKPALFGQIIIFIVFIPILVLSGIEGKMFRPMALSFSFTLIGAMILCLTYVPMVSAWTFRSKSKKNNVFQLPANYFMRFIMNLYSPILQWSLRNIKWVIGFSLSLLLFSSILFTRLGGEFVPTLDEGDFVVQPILKTGTSLTATIETMTKIESILKNNFPEVEQVISRIGAAEVPTDPMSMEEADVIIKLKPLNQWVSATNKEELANRMKEAMSVIPEIDFEFTQPIEMRFNELITGVRTDLAIKVYGENLDTLLKYASQIARETNAVKGAADVSVEKIDNVPQFLIHFNRDRLSQLGLNTREINQVIQTIIAGQKVGKIYEDEKQFDLVVRYQKEKFSDVQAIANLIITDSLGRQFPLYEVAKIDRMSGPAKIIRDRTKRRVVVGVNVRDRDLQSVVLDIQNIIDQKIKLPAGYSITYGGQFENMKNALDRLKIAVPIALILILILLYFAFQSIRQALLVFSAIPLAAIGGIIALYWRGLPFSISAGIGFIALFGLAVLNGLVLIEFFNHLKSEGIADIEERIRKGTLQRLRPVLLTASAAALGFLPMAISTSAGAEVQRPLATVVIGGLVSSTMLTLVVLPVLYLIVERWNSIKMRGRVVSKAILVIVILFGFQSVRGQTIITSEQQAVDLALEFNHELKSMKSKVRKAEIEKSLAFDLGDTEIFYGYDENNLTPTGFPLRVLGISQGFPFPTTIVAKKKYANDMLELETKQYELAALVLEKKVRLAFKKWNYLRQKKSVYSMLDSIYSRAAIATSRKYEVGEIDKLEWMNMQTYSINIHNQWIEVDQEQYMAEKEIIYLIQQEDIISISKNAIIENVIIPESIDDNQLHDNILMKNIYKLIEVKEDELRIQKLQGYPDFSFQYFIGNNAKESDQNYDGYQITIGVPLFFSSHQARVQSAKQEVETYLFLAKEKLNKLAYDYNVQLYSVVSINQKLKVYEETMIPLSNEMIKMALKKYTTGESDLFEFNTTVQNAHQILIDYYTLKYEFEQKVLNINYLTIE